MISIKLHSVTSLITNSSTTIYTYSNGSVELCKKMVDAIMKLSGSDKTCDEMFKLVVTYSDTYFYREGAEDFGIDSDKADNDIRKTQSGEIDKPEWMEKIEGEQNSYRDNPPSTSLHITPLSSEYEEAAKLIKSFLYSTSNEAVFE